MRAALVHARETNLDAFRAYQKRGVFPSNTYNDGALNVWRDQDGHFCAAATIIRMSGQTALVDKVAKDSNFIRLADVREGPLMDWMLTSGFTQEEIGAIQKPFMPPSVDENARLRALYKQVDAQLVKNEQASVELAVDRLMAHPQLARQLVLIAG